jgi:hypothetical protein
MTPSGHCTKGLQVKANPDFIDLAGLMQGEWKWLQTIWNKWTASDPEKIAIETDGSSGTETLIPAMILWKTNLHLWS